MHYESSWRTRTCDKWLRVQMNRRALVAGEPDDLCPPPSSTKPLALRFVKGAVRQSAVVARRGGVTTGHIRALPAAKLMISLEFPRMAVNLIEALGVGIVEGVTDFLPVSSTCHLTSSGARGRSSRSR